MKKLLLLFFLLNIYNLNVGYGQFYNSSRQTFGKNRVQFDEFNWTYYKFPKFEFYFYDDGKKVADYAAKSIPGITAEYQDFFDYYVNDKIYFIIYSKMSHYKQSNIDIDNANDEPGTGGVTKIAGNKVFLFFEGDYELLDQQIRRALSEIYINRMMFGENWKEVIKNSTLLNIPPWYINGLISYATLKWNSDIDDRVRDGIISERFKKFNKLPDNEAKIAGHSLWNYIAEVYGEHVIPNILYMARVSRNVESGFLFVIGLNLKELIKESNLYYKTRYESEDEIRSEPFDKPLKKIKSKKETNYNEWVVSTSGRYAAYSKNKLGKFKVFVYDTLTRKSKKIYKDGYKLDREVDLNIPQLDWHPNSDILGLILEERAELEIALYDAEEKSMRFRPLYKLDKVYDFSFSGDGKQIVLSAVKKAQSDIYIYKLSSSTLSQITNDIYDDRDVQFIDNDRRIIFSSNRMNDTLVVKKRDDAYNKIIDDWNIFAYDYKKKPDKLLRLTNTPDSDEKLPTEFSKGVYGYLSDESGIFNLYRGKIDSSIASIDTSINYKFFFSSKPVTNFRRNILTFETKYFKSGYAMKYKQDGKNKFILGDKYDDNFIDLNIPLTQFKEGIEIINDVQVDEPTYELFEEEKGSYISIDVFGVNLENQKSEQNSNDEEINIDDYQFDNNEAQNSKPSESRYITLKEEEEPKLQSIKLPQRRNYNLNFSATELITTMDFNFANQLYQPYNGGPYVNPGMGMVVKVQLYDLFDDYKFEGGARTSFNNGASEFFISLDNRKKRLDKKYTLQRQTISYVNPGIDVKKVFIHQGTIDLTWPFSEVSSLRLRTSIRNDRVVTLATERQSLNAKDSLNFNYGFKLQYIFDNIRKKGLNLANGTRFKFFFEQYREFNNFDTDISVTGFDFRQYTKLHRQIIMVNRFAGSTSFGTRKLVYYMGAVDNWIVTSIDKPKFDMNQDIAQDQNYFYQTLATPMRGFIQNARNGNSFGVINNEIRFPVIRYFANKPIKSDFWSNFQVVAFNDIGTAWTGPSPFSDKNSFNTITINNNPLTIRLDNKIDPIVYSYGGGLRSKLFGYFMKLDYAYGVENFRRKKPIIHFSIGLDI